MSKNDDSTKNGKRQLDFSKVKIPPGSSDLPSAEKALLQVPVVPQLNSRLFGFAAKILVTSNARSNPFWRSPVLRQYSLFLDYSEREVVSEVCVSLKAAVKSVPTQLSMIR